MQQLNQIHFADILNLVIHAPETHMRWIWCKKYHHCS